MDNTNTNSDAIASFNTNSNAATLRAFPLLPLLVVAAATLAPLAANAQTHGNAAPAAVAASHGNAAAAPASAWTPYITAGGAVIYNSPADLGNVTLAGGFLEAGARFRERHRFSVQAGYFTGDYRKHSFVPVDNGLAGQTPMLSDHSCCEPAAAANTEFDYESRFERDIAWAPVLLTYNYEFRFGVGGQFGLRLGPTAGVIFASDKLHQHEMDKVNDYMFHRRISKSTVTFGGGANVDLVWRLDHGLFLAAGYRFFAAPSTRFADNLKTGVNLNHQLSLALGYSF
jgi:hypothetical protein